MSNNKFEYNYSSAERDEILAIQKKYAGKSQEVSSIEELKKLDKSTTRPGVITGLTIGIAGILIMGAGMSAVMTAGNFPFWLGVIIGIIGMAVAALAYPVYNAIIKKQKEKNAPRILELSNKLLEE